MQAVSKPTLILLIPFNLKLSFWCHRGDPNKNSLFVGSISVRKEQFYSLTQLPLH